MKRLSEWMRIRNIRINLKRVERERRRVIRRQEKKLGRLSALARRRAFARHQGVSFDNNLERVQIILPQDFSFRTNHTETADCIAEMREYALVRSQPIMLHFSKLEHIDPSAALALVAEIFRIRNLRSQSVVSGTYPRSRAIYDQLIEMGFFNLLRIHELYGPPKKAPAADRPMFLRFVSGNRVDSQAVDRFVSLIENHIVPMNAVARGKLVAAIIEAMNNTLDHAHPSSTVGQTMPHRWWMSSQVHLEKKEVTIILFDQGVGIPQTLDPNLYDRIRALWTRLSPTPSDGEMIMAATELYRTSTGQSGRGRGFRNMKQFVATCIDGELRVLSNRGTYLYMPGADHHSDESVSIGGTIIEWRFRHNGSLDMQE